MSGRLRFFFLHYTRKRARLNLSRSFANMFADQSTPVMSAAKPTYVASAHVTPRAFKHRASACGHPGRYMCAFHMPPSCSTCLVKSSMVRGTAANTSTVGPCLCTRLPLRARLFQYTICARLVIIARVTPKETACASCFEASDATAPNIPANNKGQHQLPTRAGMEITTVSKLVHTPTSGECRVRVGRAPEEDSGSSDATSQVAHSSSTFRSRRRRFSSLKFSRCDVAIARLAKAGENTPPGRRRDAEKPGSVRRTSPRQDRGKRREH